MKTTLAASLPILALALTFAACSPPAAQTTAAPEAAPAAAPASLTLAGQKDLYLSAVGIGVSDLAKSTDFYVNVMGMQKVKSYHLDYMDEEVLSYPDGESAIVLMHWTDKSTHNYKDNAVKVVTRTKDPAALIEKIRAAGMTITRDYTPSAQVGGASVGLAKDPDGYVLEILPLKAATVGAPVAAPAEAPKSN
ncbi:MAG TPA: VOC family protein [Hyphomonadaceae bacterium]|jgi:lactoylglutathione lyase|nr:VOC family protein [Hyphomonadaceae bacterium]